MKELLAIGREKKHSAKRIHGAFPKGQAGAFERTLLFQVSKTLTLLLCQKMMIALALLHLKAQNVLNFCLLTSQTNERIERSGKQPRPGWLSGRIHGHHGQTRSSLIISAA